MKLSTGALYILDTLESAGYRADVVGGPVRDFMLGKEPSDYDITTSALPEEVKAVFAEHKTVDTGIRHGTVTVIVDSEPYEITTYRTDGEYKDSRHPESVSFTSDITEDLARRDFTVNAMAYSPRYGITDPFGGREDLTLRTIRAVGEPSVRFGEDALRILRAVRFSSVLGFEIEPATADALRSLSHLLTNISAERIYTEWTKLLTGESAYSVIRDFSDVISVIIPELSSLTLPHPEHFLAAEPFIRHLALFALSSHSPSDAWDSAMRRLRAPTAYRESGIAVLSHLDVATVDSLSDAGRLLHVLGAERTRMLVSLKILLGDFDARQSLTVEDYISRGMPYSISDLSVRGDDMLRLGVRGREIGEMLERMLVSVIDGELENTREALTDYARALISK